MNGAESLVKTLIASEVELCFANPGTSEMHFVAALDRVPGMKCVLGLHETVVTGMADGYFRMARKPASTLLHCGPGLANGLANLHNARRGRSGVVNIVGDMTTTHRPFDAPLASDTAGLAGVVSDWVRTVDTPAEIGAAAAEAVSVARQAQIATLILPADSSWREGGVPVAAAPAPAPLVPDLTALENAATVLRQGGARVLILLGGNGAMAEGQPSVARIAQATGAQLLTELLTARLRRGNGTLGIERQPAALQVALERLKQFTDVILVGSREPVAFFGYPDSTSRLLDPATRVHILSEPRHDSAATLQALADLMQAPAVALPPGPARPDVASGAITPESFARSLAALLPDEAIVVDEAITFGRGMAGQSFGMAPHDWLALTGGAIGDGLPMATGAAIATEGSRRVVSLQADGSAAYSLQALWTQARENLPCTTLLISNRRYEILIGEYRRMGATPGATAMEMLDLGRPDLNWCKLAEGFGVEAAPARSMEEVNDLMQTSFRRPGPFLIEMIV